jgi:IclR family pca regulon transcriptional regulator
VLDGTDIVYIARVATRRIMSVGIAVGTRFPAYATSMGRVLLAALDGDDLEAYLSTADLRPLTARTIHDPAALRREIDHVRAQGWALVDQELERGLTSLAAPWSTAPAAPSRRSTSRRRPSTAPRRSPRPRPPLLECAAAIGADLAAQDVTG